MAYFTKSLDSDEPDVRPHEVWIYGLVDPRTDKLRYVGRTSSLAARIAQHRGPQASKRVRKWIAELHALGLKPIVARLMMAPPGVDSADLERLAMVMHARTANLNAQKCLDWTRAVCTFQREGAEINEGDDVTIEVAE